MLSAYGDGDTLDPPSQRRAAVHAWAKTMHDKSDDVRDLLTPYFNFLAEGPVTATRLRELLK
jgi:hypothetical protein